MKITHQNLNLPLLHPFTLGNGSSRTHTAITLLTLSTPSGYSAYGEAAMPPYLSENHASVDAFLQELKPKIFNSIREAEALHAYLNKVTSKHPAIKAAIDMAWHQLQALETKQSLNDYLNIPIAKNKQSTFTLGIAELPLLEQKLNEGQAFGFTRFKAKLGSVNDKEIIKHIRQLSNAPLFVDVNQGWSDKEEALDMLYFLEEHQVLFAEQPLPKSDFKGQDWLVQRSPIPIFADEACQDINDLETVKNLYHGINLKLMKCGGIYPATQLITTAKEAKLQTMIGCMTETSCATFAALQLAPLVDFIDLDGPWILAEQPFLQPDLQNGCIQLQSLQKR